MPTDKEKAGLRGLVQRAEIRVQNSLVEFCVYDLKGRILEWFSPENAMMEQEPLKHFYIYDHNDGRLIEKRGCSEDDTVKKITKYIYDDNGKLAETTSTNCQEFSTHHIFYDQKGNVTRIHNYDGKSGSLEFVQIWHYNYKEENNKLEERVFKEQGKPPLVRGIKDPYNGRKVIFFDDAGKKIRVERYFNDWLAQLEIYNENGQKIEFKLFAGSNRLAQHDTYDYDERENLVAECYRYDSNIRKYLYEYDEWNNKIKSFGYNNGVPETEENNKYNYDSQKNWTKKIQIKTNKEGVESKVEYEKTFNYF